MTNPLAKLLNSNETKPTSTGKANSVETKPANEKAVSLKTICSEMKLDPRVAREKLRIAVRDTKKFPELAKAHKPRSAWEWSKGSAAEKEARLALS